MGRVIELFAGAGGAALGIEAAGFEHAALCELDADACGTLREAGLGPVVEGDVRDLDSIACVAGESCDVIWSSFPCQAWSVAGKRKGARDERNGWPWTVDAIDRFKPTWFVGENVRGLTFHKKVDKKVCPGKVEAGAGDPTRCPGCYLDMVIIPQLKERFAHAGYFVLDAADFGVAQHRKRLFIWAGPEPLKKPQLTHGPKTDAPWVTMRQALGVTKVIGGGSNPRVKNAPGDRSYRELTDEPSTTIAAVQIGNAGPFVIHSMRNTKANPRQERPVPSTEPAPTINGRGNQILQQGETSRRLTVKERAKLQGFPDNHPFVGTKTSRFRQVGNAVPPLLAQAVLTTIKEVSHG